MESIRRTAQVYYKTMPEDVRRSAKDFFKKMDSNEDGKVSLAEFAGFMAEVGCVAMNNTSFFKEINKNKNGELDFDDVKTLYYILRSGRPLCGGCTKFIEGMYFTCIECFTCEAQSFCLHRDCFGRGEYVHKHSAFVDNYVLLESIRCSGLLGGDAQENKSLKSNKFKGSTSTPLEIVPISSKSNKFKGSTSTPLEIVPISSKSNKYKGSTSTPLEIVPIPSKSNKFKGSTSTPLEIVPISSKSNKFKGSTSTPLEIVPVSSKSNKYKGSTSTPLEIVPIQRDERKVAWENLLAALGMTANIASIVAALGTCTIL